MHTCYLRSSVVVTPCAWGRSHLNQTHSIYMMSFLSPYCVLCVWPVLCSGGWERNWGYCLGAIGWDAVILSFCFLLFDGDGEKWEADYGGLRVTGGTQGFRWGHQEWLRITETAGRSWHFCVSVYRAYSLWINCKLKADAIKSYELLIAMWCIAETARLLFCTLGQRRSFEILILNAASFSFFCWWQSFSEICIRSLSLFLPLPLSFSLCNHGNCLEIG